MSQMECAHFGKFLTKCTSWTLPDRKLSPWNFLVDVVSKNLLGVPTCVETRGHSAVCCYCCELVKSTMSSRIGLDVSTLWCGQSHGTWKYGLDGIALFS